MHDLGARLGAEHRDRHDRGEQRAAHVLGVLVNEEHPVGVAVEGEPDVGAVFEHRRLQVLLVLGVQRIGRVVREGPVELRNR